MESVVKMTDKEKNSSDANNSHDEGDLLADPDAHLSLEEKEEVVCDPPPVTSKTPSN